MAKDVIILGAGGHAKVIANIIEESGDNVVGFLDDNKEIKGKIIYNNKHVMGTFKDIDKYKNLLFIIGIGSNQVRKMINDKYILNYYTAIHPTAIISKDVKIGVGSVVMAGAIINPGTIIGKHCVINTKASIDHDNTIEDFVHLSPGVTLAGTVNIKELTWIGTSATIINNITIEKNNIIGAGAVVVKNIDDTNKTFVGVPAKELKK